MMVATARRLMAGAPLVLVFGLAPVPAAADDCAAETAELARTEAELPMLDLTRPIHHQLVCITLETLVDFARRVDLHVGRCPASDYAAKAAIVAAARKDYAAKFRQHRCRRSL
jgi:hypothetical protein